jgi:NitT/TauT family transport system substrate-binding protein
MSMTRRTAMRCATLAAAAAAAASLAPAAGATERLRLLLNTGMSGPLAFFVLAQQRGYLAEAGIDLQLSTGGGAAAIVPQVVPGRYEAGYGDIAALIELIARGRPDEGPVAIYTTFNATPLTIAVDAAGPIRVPRDFEGRTIIGHGSDAALLMFDLFAAATGIDLAKVNVQTSWSGMGSQVAEMLGSSQVHGVFGFVNTIIASITPLGIDPQRVRFINFAEHLPEMYGNTLFVTREAWRQHRALLPRLVRALNRALADTAANPDVAIDALLKHAPGANREVNRVRLVGTLKAEMAHPEGARIGLGDIDDARLARMIERIVSVKRLPRKPALSEVFDRSFLPPAAERIRSLARG